MLIPVILSGGSGTRLWPLSRKDLPKQFLALVDEEQTLFQQTLARASRLPEAHAPIIVCSETHRFVAAEQARAQLENKPGAIILEPVARNTAPAITAAALLAQEIDSDANIIIFPADHIIYDSESFIKAVADSYPLLEKGYLLTFGIRPQTPETGFGYISRGKTVGFSAFAVDKFVEKPDLPTAIEYLESGDYDWNSGIFMFKASDFLNEISRYAPEVLTNVSNSLENSDKDMDFIRLEQSSFECSPNVSIDYAVMERTKKAAVIPVECGWNDIGSWSALWEVLPKDENQNHIKGDVITINTQSSMIMSHDRHVIATVGIDDLIVVSTPDATLIAAKDQVQYVKSIVDKLKASNRTEHLSHRIVYRPWGCYNSIDSGARFQVKRIIVKPGASLSSQKHYHRAEHWIVVSGTAEVTCDDKVMLLSENQSTYLPLGSVHRLHNPGKLPLELIEVQSGSYLGEDDIVRFDDIYGRK
jgi:mannose-1-phosphate guanylyltransferase / mannose-6-phosphate isomerase